MLYALTVIWFEFRRYLAAVLVVAAGTALMGLQFGIMIGLISLVSTPIDKSTADIWITSQDTPSCDLALPISRDWVNRVWDAPGVVATDEVIMHYTTWHNPESGNALSVILGFNVSDTSLGPVQMLTPEQRILLTELGSVVVDRRERARLGVRKVGDMGEIAGQRVRVVGFTSGMTSVTGPYILCSLETARKLLFYTGIDSNKVTFILARCQSPEMVPNAVRHLQGESGIAAYSSFDFSEKSRWYWLIMTKAGLAVGFVALLGLGVGGLIATQTLYSATLALAKELALLRALGAPLVRIMWFVMYQAGLIGVAGVLLGLIMMELLVWLAERMGAHPYMNWELRLGCTGIVLIMVLASGGVALLSLRRTEPIQLLR
ncbi:MAG TPA: ABC transporter permease [Gemmataceae bacterium]|jgi:putative ABC transport system permease protein|nr:ABC transporter permease [Gemmataceae bacterium]